MSVLLEEDAQKQFHERGFLVVPSLLFAEDVERYLGVTTRAFRPPRWQKILARRVRPGATPPA